jgi:DNA-binding GntR family transcriptional regulator
MRARGAKRAAAAGDETPPRRGRAVSGDGRGDPVAALDARPLAQRLVERIREDVVRGALPAGAAVSQVALAARYGVSHVPLREALRQLEAEGYVLARPFRRALVCPLSASEAREIGEARKLLQGHLLRRAAPRITGSLLRRADALCAAHERETDPARGFDALSALEDLLFAPARSPVLLSLNAHVRGLARRYFAVWRAAAAEERGGSPSRRALLRYLREGDVEGAVRALEARIDAVTELTSRALERVGRRAARASADGDGASPRRGDGSAARAAAAGSAGVSAAARAPLRAARRPRSGRRGSG